MGRDRFDHSVDHKVESKPARLQRIEVITGVERRRKCRWLKLAVVVESLAESAVVSKILSTIAIGIIIPPSKVLI